MNRNPVKSSRVLSIGYDPDTRILELEFNNKTVYQYSPISPGGYDLLMASESKGKFIQEHIINNAGVTCTKTHEPKNN
jgi:hypothetical protein